MSLFFFSPPPPPPPPSLSLSRSRSLSSSLSMRVRAPPPTFRAPNCSIRVTPKRRILSARSARIGRAQTFARSSSIDVPSGRRNEKDILPGLARPHFDPRASAQRLSRLSLIRFLQPSFEIIHCDRSFDTSLGSIRSRRDTENRVREITAAREIDVMEKC